MCMLTCMWGSDTNRVSHFAKRSRHNFRGKHFSCGLEPGPSLFKKIALRIYGLRNLSDKGWWTPVCSWPWPGQRHVQTTTLSIQGIQACSYSLDSHVHADMPAWLRHGSQFLLGKTLTAHFYGKHFSPGPEPRPVCKNCSTSFWFATPPYYISVRCACLCCVYVRAPVLACVRESICRFLSVWMSNCQLLRARGWTNTNACARRFSKVFLPTSDSWTLPRLHSTASDRTCGLPTTWLCTALGSSSQHHCGVKSCTAYTLPTRAKTAPYAALDKSSTGQESRRTSRTWSAVAPPALSGCHRTHRSPSFPTPFRPDHSRTLPLTCSTTLAGPS